MIYVNDLTMGYFYCTQISLFAFARFPGLNEKFWRYGSLKMPIDFRLFSLSIYMASVRPQGTMAFTPAPLPPIPFLLALLSSLLALRVASAIRTPSRTFDRQSVRSSAMDSHVL